MEKYRVHIISLFLVIFLCLGFHVDAQKYEIRKFEHSQFKLDADISCVIQDDNGLIWIGTKSGLFRYDGYEMLLYEHEVNNPRSLSHNYITDLVSDEEGDLWISTYGGGLNHMDQKKEVFTSYAWEDKRASDLLANTCLGHIVNDNQFIGTRDGLLEVNLLDNDLQKIILEDEEGITLTAGFISDIHTIDPDNAIVASNVGLFRISRQQDSLFNSRLIFTGEISSIIQWKGHYAIGTNTGLYSYDDELFTFEPINNPNDKLAIQDLSVANKHQLWVATDNGVYNYDNGWNQVIEGDFEKIFQDESGMLWCVTANEGIYNIIAYTNSFVPITQTTGSKIEGIDQVDGIVWIRSYDGTYWIDGDSRKPLELSLSSELKQLLSEYRAPKILKDSEGDLWISVYEYGLLEIRADHTGRYNIIAEYRTDNSDIGLNEILGIAEDKDRNIWAATFGNGLSKIDQDERSVVNYNTSNSNIGFRALSNVRIDQEEEIWISSFGNGLEYFDGTEFEGYRDRLYLEDSLSHEIIVTFLMDSNLIWAGTISGGLNKIDRVKKSIEVFTKKDGLAGNLIYAIEQDGNNNIWVNTDLGISMLNTSTGVISNYDEDDGLPSQEGEFFSMEIAGDYCYVGTSSGAYYFNLDSLSVDQYEPKLMLRSLHANYEEIPISDNLKLSYHQKDVSFELSSSDYRMPENTLFHYRLQGYQDAWNTIGQDGRINYTNLAPGSYTLQTYSTNSYGYKADNQIEINFTITPAWWHTAWFKVLCGLALFTLLYLLYRLRTAHLVKENQFLLQKEKIHNLEKEKKILTMNAMIEGQEAERTRIAKDLHDGLGGLLSTVKAHFSNIQSEIQKIEKINVYNRANELVDEACDEVRRISHNLMPGDLRLEGLSMAVHNLGEEMSQAHPFTVNVETVGFTSRMEESKEVFVYRIIQEALNNIIKHAQAKNVLIQLSETAEEYHFIVEDDGQGFDPLQIESGLGLKSIQSRVDFLKGTLDIDTRLGVGTTLSWHISK